ncbi:dihydroxyacetone kinase phosphoryl donor subunit DhaM [Actinorugispora endophytica]|uniref:phosphoenolpyruvate--glycerone phosphotransferase n=1 Tax=Actinorugispora endophytica TaxID=1605990 RepID=A0A4R6UNX2_9ACTN|nr:dihydroxyacetone kinase phosphoryl donor subunit DhaM [Actinorugispora endophytica]TDQ47203.1 dihydroxyacetone kinase phosphotransfer subunit [Actinorugispora endophytica]
MAATVGIVLVSHSSLLAEGVAELIGALGSGRVGVRAAGGTDDGGVGTSYEKVVRAVDEADSGAGVVVLADLGSAVLTARMVLEDGADPRAVLVDAPFVEGAVAATVTANTGADLVAVVAAAEEARGFRKL